MALKGHFSDTTQPETRMHPVIVKTFGGLSKAYYFRQLFFGGLIPTFILLIASNSAGGIPLNAVIVLTVNTLLYPYARFVYEGVANFIMGSNVFFVNAALLMFLKFLTMLLCWGFAIFIAPAGLAYLYYHHSKRKSPEI